MCVSSHAGSPLTVNQLVVAVNTVTDWHGLGLQLGLAMSQLEQIEQHIVCQMQGPSRLMAEMLNVWLKSSPTASWADLITALKAIGQNKVANDVKAAYSPTGMDICIAATVVVSIVLFVLFVPISEQDHTVPDPVTSEQDHTVPDPVTSEQDHTVPDPVTSEQDHTVPDPVTSEQDHTVPDPVTSEQDHTVPDPVAQVSGAKPMKMQLFRFLRTYYCEVLATIFAVLGICVLFLYQYLT